MKLKYLWANQLVAFHVKGHWQKITEFKAFKKKIRVVFDHHSSDESLRYLGFMEACVLKIDWVDFKCILERAEWIYSVYMPGNKGICARPLLIRICAISEVVGCLSLLSPSPPHVFLCFMCVSCPSSSIQSPVYHDNSCLPRPSPMSSPDHGWLLAGALSLPQPTLDHKGPGRTG